VAAVTLAATVATVGIAEADTLAAATVGVVTDAQRPKTKCAPELSVLILAPVGGALNRRSWPNLAAVERPSISAAARLAAWLSPPRRTRNALQFRLGLFK
jgi:hypothetical protein